MLIDINTDELQNAVQIARRANENLSEAAMLLNSVVVHTDWQCPERSEINENTGRNRSQALKLQADAESLFNSINYAAEQFLAAEKELARSFENVDGPIAGFLSRTPAGGNMTTAGHGPDRKSEFWNAAKDALQSAGGGVRDAMDVVNFKNLAEAFRGK